MASTLLFVSLLGLTVAQSSTLSIPFYGFDTQSIVASVVAANPSATTMQLACLSGTDSNDCGLFPDMTLVYGPSTYHLDMGVGDENAFTGTADCSRGANTALCTEFATGTEANFPGSSTTTYEAEDILTLPVTVTGGAEKLGSAQASATGSASASASASASGSGSATSGSAASSTTASITKIAGTNSASVSGVLHTEAASATPSTGAASANSVFLHSGLLSAVASLLGQIFFLNRGDATAMRSKCLIM
ncbi:hypothetical protein EKO04_006686 [Ascochyta lentis]|uniref:Uncharacterized protein n=1 Tax=Ascochyta lentis TaxID=205686 RepID=A0A8H7MGN5_9PLEO|nr:hypothetical protein EKO04_006686 [Ascochyta lentis]